MNNWNNRPLEGCLFEDTAVAAPLVLSHSTATLPSQVDLRPFCSPVEDQRQTNSCTANATVSALEYYQRRTGLNLTGLSRMFVYYNARKLIDQENYDCGSYIQHVMASVLAYGACEEQLWPFDPRLRRMCPSPAAYADAKKHLAIQYGRAPLGGSALTALAEGIPVVFGTRIPSEFYTVADQTGIMPMPGPVVKASGPGHAMLLVGYDLHSRNWIVRNSYGPDFGNNGYFELPFATMKAYSVPIDFWIIGAIEQNGIVLKQDALPAADFEAPTHLEINLDSLRTSIQKTLASNLKSSQPVFAFY